MQLGNGMMLIQGDPKGCVILLIGFIAVCSGCIIYIVIDALTKLVFGL